MKNNFLLIFLLLVSVSLMSQHQLYRNDEHNFRIKFPKGWEIKDGDGPNVVQKAVNEGASIIIIVKDLVTPEMLEVIRTDSPDLANVNDKELSQMLIEEFDFNNYSDDELIEIANEQLGDLKHKFGDIKILQTRVTYLDNERFAFSLATFSYNVHNIRVKAKSMMFSIIRKGKLYQIQAAAEIDNFSMLESTFIQSINTFVFEEYDLEDLPNEKSQKTEYDIFQNYYDREFPNKNMPSTYLIFFVVFVISPSISIIVRFLALKKSMKEKKALALSIGLFFVVLFFWIYLYQKPDLFLYLLAIVIGLNYFILRYPSKIEFSSNKGDNPNQTTNNHNYSETLPKTEFYDAKKDITQYEEIDDSNLTAIEKDKLYAKVLGLKGKLTKKDIKRIYRNLIDKYHPDKVSHLGIEFQEYAQKKTKDINKAYSYFKRKYNI